MKHTIITRALAASLTAALCTLAPLSAAPATDDKKPAPSAPAQIGDDYRLGPGDKLRIEVYKDSQLSQSVQVRPDAITASLKEYVTNPTVTVIVVEALASQVYVMGEVTNPGTMQLHGPTTILQALAMAGGFKEFANTKDVKVLRPRNGNNGIETIRFNYKEVINGDAKPFYLRSGDTVIVP